MSSKETKWKGVEQGVEKPPIKRVRLSDIMFTMESFYGKEQFIPLYAIIDNEGIPVEEGYHDLFRMKAKKLKNDDAILEGQRCMRIAHKAINQLLYTILHDAMNTPRKQRDNPPSNYDDWSEEEEDVQLAKAPEPSKKRKTTTSVAKKTEPLVKKKKTPSRSPVKKAAEISEPPAKKTKAAEPKIQKLAPASTTSSATGAAAQAVRKK